MLWCCVEPERIGKTTPIMEALAAGFGGRVCTGEPPDDGEMFLVWGQLWTTLKAVPKAIASGRPYLHLDNGYILPARGTPEGYYRITYNGPSPILWRDAPAKRINVPFYPWRQTGSHILVGLPGAQYGRAWGMDTEEWVRRCITKLRQHTQRRAQTRIKRSATPLARDLRNAWAVYTHSSNIAVDAVLAGIPVFCEKTCPAAPVGNLDLSRIDNPAMPERDRWLDSLIAQQYTLDEMRSGLARDYLGAVIKAHKERAGCPEFTG